MRLLESTRDCWPRRWGQQHLRRASKERRRRSRPDAWSHTDVEHLDAARAGAVPIERALWKGTVLGRDEGQGLARALSFVLQLARSQRHPPAQSLAGGQRSLSNHRTHLVQLWRAHDAGCMPGRLYEAPDTKVRDLTPAPWCRDVMTAAGEEALRWCTGRDGCICRALLPQLLVLSPIAKRLVAGEPALIRDVTPGCAGRNSFLALAHADGSGGGADCTPRRALERKRKINIACHLFFGVCGSYVHSRSADTDCGEERHEGFLGG